MFHFINKKDLLVKYKLHTSAEDLTKNRASRKDVIKFALIQQAAQCLLGYLMADNTERFMPPEYAVTLWAQRLRTVETVGSQWIRYAANIVPWIIHGSDLSKLTTFRKAIVEEPSNYLIGGATQTLMNASHDPVPFSALEMYIGKAMYWILYPMFQYILAMSAYRINCLCMVTWLMDFLVLADTFQYFTHRAFHVNKWLYSKFFQPWSCFKWASAG